MPACFKLATLQRLSLETGLLLTQASNCLTEIDEEAAREEAAREEQQKALEIEGSAGQLESAPREASSALDTSALAAQDLLQAGDKDQPSLSTLSNGLPAESLQHVPSRESSLAAGDAHTAEPLGSGAKSSSVSLHDLPAVMPTDTSRMLLLIS